MPLGTTDNPSAAPLTPGRIEELIRLSRPRARGSQMWRGMLPMLIVAASVMLLLGSASNDPLGRVLLPMGLLLAAMLPSWWLRARVKRTHALHTQAMQALQMRHWPGAQQALAELLASPVEARDMRVTALLGLSQVARHAGLHDQAVQLCEEILGDPRNQAYHPTALVEKAFALLLAERLTDANSLLDGFRAMEFREPTATLAALAGLYRQIRTMKYHDAASQADTLGPRARTHLSQQAGYAYAMLALALERIGQAQRAQQFYDCATRLMTPAELAERFPELQALEHQLLPARSPL